MKTLKTEGNFVDGMTELNVPIIKDSADGNNTGAFWYPLSLDPDDEERSTSQGFYTANRPNLHLLTETQVTKLIFKNSGYAGPVATGVTYSSDGEDNKTVSVLKEVIVAVGALHTPQLLQLSGIGDKSLLGSLGIETLVDLPGVGANYQDHPLLITAQTGV
jgi:choline dehydrogenase-like flavoprotein